MAANDSPDEIDTYLFGPAGHRAAMNQSVRFLVGHLSLHLFGLCVPDLQADPGGQPSVEVIWQPLPAAADMPTWPSQYNRTIEAHAPLVNVSSPA